ncbi:uncharacterized protein Z519_01311 [Cladophialophora bantiana CBS 173.52]|uniref:Uncharacterized protein n=1 Tax=Cladophialophora bantiana (strain ATCC 10958 / CBS 173.52 / CDC B-1940 / NIH 8579) TaxID=1442370 RepID=A0A0D2GH93_CLAB1|nr:uncharacterized protein Z519_01311 [Cladophialophora bantiana CBS 173.52]KIW97727.1 hypothetical protein Z519_01311 [Cladophialophora bantiana CBS 173.52]
MRGESSTSVKLLANAVPRRGPRQPAKVKEETWVGPGRGSVVVDAVDPVVETKTVVEEPRELSEAEGLLLTTTCEVDVKENTVEGEIDVDEGGGGGDSDVDSEAIKLLVGVVWLVVGDDVEGPKETVEDGGGGIDEETVDEGGGDEAGTEAEETTGVTLLVLV